MPLPQVQTGQAAEVPTIAVHVVEPNPPDAPMASAATVAALLGHGTGEVPIAGSLSRVFLTTFNFVYPYPLPSDRVPAPKPRQFEAKNMLEC